jgi:hypothetical protein
MEAQEQVPEVTEEQKQEAEHKNLMEKIKAAVTVFRHNNQGKVPSLDDVSSVLEQGNTQQAEQEQQEPEEVDHPKCLSYSIFHGKDPQRPLYYHDPSDMGYFDVQKGMWQLDKPELLDHLTSREPQSQDLAHMILHGIMDDGDYDRLDKAGMIDESGKALREKLGMLKDRHQELQKSIDDISEQETAPEMFMDQKDPMFDFDQKGIVTEVEASYQDQEAMGEDLVRQLIETALSPASCPKMVLDTIRAQIALAMGRNVADLFPEEKQPAKETEQPKEEPSEEKPEEKADKPKEKPEEKADKPKEKPEEKADKPKEKSKGKHPEEPKPE